jgi:hypothetical protein
LAVAQVSSESTIKICSENSKELKGTVQRDFLTPVFFTKRLILVSIGMPRSDFEIFRIFAELFVLKLFKNLLFAVNYSEESKTEP